MLELLARLNVLVEQLDSLKNAPYSSFTHSLTLMMRRINIRVEIDSILKDIRKEVYR